MAVATAAEEVVRPNTDCRGGALQDGVPSAGHLVNSSYILERAVSIVPVKTTPEAMTNTRQLMRPCRVIQILFTSSSQHGQGWWLKPWTLTFHPFLLDGNENPTKTVRPSQTHLHHAPSSFCSHPNRNHPNSTPSHAVASPTGLCSFLIYPSWSHVWWVHIWSVTWENTSGMCTCENVHWDTYPDFLEDHNTPQSCYQAVTLETTKSNQPWDKLERHNIYKKLQMLKKTFSSQKQPVGTLWEKLK